MNGTGVTGTGVIDIVIGTHNRLTMLRRVVARISMCTTTPHRLTIIDDASTDGTAEWAKAQGLRVHRHKKQAGMHGNISEVYALSESDPVICTDDDAFCPLLDPDWLQRLLDALKRRPTLMMLGLNNPGDNITGSRHPYADDGEVILSKHVSGHFLALRRSLLEVTPTLFATREAQVSPNKTQAAWVHKRGGTVGYLREVYTWHFCAESIRRPGKRWDKLMITPVNMRTLEPPEEYRQCRK